MIKRLRKCYFLKFRYPFRVWVFPFSILFFYLFVFSSSFIFALLLSASAVILGNLIPHKARFLTKTSALNKEIKGGQIVIAPGLKIEAKYQNEFIKNNNDNTIIGCLVVTILILVMGNIFEEAFLSGFTIN